MPVYLGLDIGSNSVGSAWVDLDHQQVYLAASVFPAGVDEQEDKRGAPKNQARRQTRSQRRLISRRASRKRKLTRFLIRQGLLPADPARLREIWNLDPWHLRRRAIAEPLMPFEFGRVVLHLAQRRGAVGVTTDPDDPEEGKVKEGMDRLADEMAKADAQTVGQFIADRMDQARQPVQPAAEEQCSRRTRQRRRRQADKWASRNADRPEPHYQAPVRNRQYRMSEDQMLFAGRDLVRREFLKIVETQRSWQDSELAAMLTKELVRELDDPTQDGTWRHRGLLFGQRRTYWDTGTLGRCVLEPTDRCVPIADRHASYFRVLETVNNIRIQQRGCPDRALPPEKRQAVLNLLRGPLGVHAKGKHAGKPKTKVSVAEIKALLGIKPRDKDRRLNIEADEEREINTDWFRREIVHGAIGLAKWSPWEQAERLAEEAERRAAEAGQPRPERSAEARRPEAINRAILKFDPDEPADELRLRAAAISYWGLDTAAADRLIAAWKQRPKLEKRLNLSRRAVLNLLPYMEKFDEGNDRWPTQQEARKTHAKVLQARFDKSGGNADRIAAHRYDLAALGLRAADRYYMRLRKHQIKHNGEIVRDPEGRALAVPPPAPTLSNPVVRKAIHEVRRHLVAYLQKFRRKPDRVVIEFARGVKETTKRRNLQLKANREREQERKRIEEDLRGWGIPESNWKKAVLRVRLCREQKGVCPFSLKGPNANRVISEKMAAEGREVEIEHIVPEAISGKTLQFNNVVLCFREANRGKGMRTPADWLGPEGVQAMLQRLESAPIRDNRVKWERLQVPTPDEEGFRNSQLTDTAYAARQVAAYLADALYDGHGLPERGGARIIFTTKGEHTARLRADWGLHESTIDRGHGLEQAPSPEALRDDPGLDQASRQARKEPKDRSDHRHHAVDALVTALVGPELLTDLGRMAREDREYKERTGHWPRRRAVGPPAPWTTCESFRDDVFACLETMVVSRRPVKRRVVGAFHEETHYGPVLPALPRHRTEQHDSLFTNRIAADRLTPNHLRVPEGWDDLSSKLEDANLPRQARRAIARELAGMEDPSPAKSGIVRDRALRDRLRKCLRECLRANNHGPDDFTAAEIKKLAAEGKLTMASGVPIKSVVLLRTIADPVIIPRKKLDSATGKMAPDMDPNDHHKPHPRTKRVYIGGNNHHVEIRERQRARKGQLAAEWVAPVVSTFEAAKRVRLAACDAVDRSENDQGAFVMSLAEGEMIYARRKDRPEQPPSYYVVCKLDKAGNSSRIHFAPHWDARKASEQDRWDVTPADLKACGPEIGKPPQKVRVGPLGDVTVLDKD
jgi:CRISPR-associated endonuclease Csn1